MHAPSPSPTSREGRGVELKLIANGLINIDCNEVPHKPEKDGAWSAQVDEHMGILGE